MSSWRMKTNLGGASFLSSHKPCLDSTPLPRSCCLFLACSSRSLNYSKDWNPMETLWELEGGGWSQFLTVKVEKSSSSSSFLFANKKAFTPFLTQFEALLAPNQAPKETCRSLPLLASLTVVGQMATFSSLLEMTAAELSQNTVRTNELMFVEACGNVKCSVLLSLSERGCLIRLSTGPRDFCWGAGPACEVRWLWQSRTLFPEWAQISYFNTGDTAFC